jgi:hypothetical protein
VALREEIDPKGSENKRLIPVDKFEGLVTDLEE